MKIGLYGIQGVYNFGCEAIVRGAYKFIKDIYPKSEITYFSHLSELDKVILADLDINIEQIKFNKSFFGRGINKISKHFNFEQRLLLFNYAEIIDSVDVIVSIGGDIYTIPQILREQKKYTYYNPLVDFCDKAIKKGKKVIVYGASVGPWGDYQKAIDYNVKALSKYELILCREAESIDYLHALGLKNVMFFPDPAFQIKEQRPSIRKNYIGINLSPLSLKELYGNYDDVYVNGLASLLDKLYESTNIELLFIPHVLSYSEKDNDLLFMKKIKSKMTYQESVYFADTSKGFIGLKEYLSQCYVVIAARMHCAVNAIDENVPAIFLSYSQKSVGMCKYIYGNYKYLIDLKKIEEELIDKTKEALSCYEMLSIEIASRNNEINQYYENNIVKVRKLVEDKI